MYVNCNMTIQWRHIILVSFIRCGPVIVFCRLIAFTPIYSCRQLIFEQGFSYTENYYYCMFPYIFFEKPLKKNTYTSLATSTPVKRTVTLMNISQRVFGDVIMFFVCPQEGRATVNQDTKLDNRVIDLRVSCNQS